MKVAAPTRPDWRWARVVELSKYSDTQALARLKKEDRLTQRAFRFKRALDRGFGENDYWEVAQAHDIFMNSAPLRNVIDALLLAGVGDEEIVLAARISDADVIKSYERLFFDVRDYRKHYAWICTAVFGGAPHRGAHLHDERGLMLRAAWLGGAGMAQQMVRGDLPHPELIQRMDSVIRDLIRRATIDNAMVISSRSDQASEFMRISLDMEEAKAIDTADELQTSVVNFLDGLTLTVADPTDQRNLELPAREQREAVYKVIEHE